MITRLRMSFHSAIIIPILYPILSFLDFGSLEADLAITAFVDFFFWDEYNTLYTHPTFRYVDGWIHTSYLVVGRQVNCDDICSVLILALTTYNFSPFYTDACYWQAHQVLRTSLLLRDIFCAITDLLKPSFT